MAPTKEDLILRHQKAVANIAMAEYRVAQHDGVHPIRVGALKQKAKAAKAEMESGVVEKPIRISSGAKVGWEVYRLKRDALARAAEAKRAAVILRQQGYDFGYLVPGTVTKVKGGYEVVIP